MYIRSRISYIFKEKNHDREREREREKSESLTDIQISVTRRHPKNCFWPDLARLFELVPVCRRPYCLPGEFFLSFFSRCVPITLLRNGHYVTERTVKQIRRRVDRKRDKRAMWDKEGGKRIGWKEEKETNRWGTIITQRCQFRVDLESGYLFFIVEQRLSIGIGYYTR